MPRRPDDDVIDLRALWNMLMRRRWTVISTVAAVVVAAFVYTAMQTPIYRATTTMQLEGESAKVVEFDDVVAQETDPYSFYETQYELLRSRNLARRVIDQLGLYQADAKPAEPGLLAQLKASLFGSDADEAKAADAAEEPAAAPDLEGALLGSLTVEPVRDSRLVRLHFVSPDAEEAALVVNTLARAFVDMNLERRFEASTYAKTFLEERIKQVRADLEDSERRFMLYTQERGIISQEDKLGVLTAKLQELSSALVAAETARIGAESRYQETLTVDAGTLMQMLENKTIEKLRETKVKLQTERTEQARLYKPEYPSMQQLDRKIAEIDGEIAAEIASMRAGIQAEFQLRLREETKLQESIAATREEILDLEERSTDFTTLKREVDTNRELYDGLLQRMKEVGVAAGIANNNISVVDAAAVPQGPFSPSLSRNLALALVLGLFAGVGLAFLFEMLDDTVKSNADLEKLMNKPVLGVIPKVAAGTLAGPVTPAGLPRTDLGLCRGLPLDAHRADVLHRGRRAAGAALHQRRAGRGQDHHLGEHRDQLRPDRRQRAADRRGPAQPLVAQGVQRGQPQGPGELPHRRLGAGRGHATHRREGPVPDEQRAHSAEPGRAARRRPDGGPGLARGQAFRLRGDRRPAAAGPGGRPDPGRRGPRHADGGGRQQHAPGRGGGGPEAPAPLARARAGRGAHQVRPEQGRLRLRLSLQLQLRCGVR